MSAAESLPVDRAALLPKPSPEPGGRIYLRDLPMPPELLPEIEERVRRYGGWFHRAAERRYAENAFKLRWYFGGHLVAYLYSRAGIAVLVVDVPNEEGIVRTIRNQLPETEREQLRCCFVRRWNDDVAQYPSFTELT